jgi:hypothetical protein
MMKNFAAYSIALMLVVSSVSRASAIVLVGSPPPPPPSSTALGVGGGFAVGIIATAGLLCLYDVWLKITGVKNWDGSPKVVQVSHHHGH